MQTMELKIAKIGNSRGVRIPSDVLHRYAFTDGAIMVERVDGILLCPKVSTDVKMSWADTANAMAESSESWADWDEVASDGLADLTWGASCVAEKREVYGKTQKKVPRRRS
jgi:antitoxin component of MazEF toxin-antitoxin module